jgi:hypothetical protein
MKSMKHSKVVSIAAALGLALLLAACGGGGKKSNTSSQGPAVQNVNPAHVARNAMSAHSMQINMGQLNNSGETGSATVADAKHGGVDVTVKLNNEPKGASEPAHIHKGTCAKLDPVPWKPLTAVDNGKSFTHVPGLSVAELKKGKYAINVHKSANDLKTYVSCGDLVP